MFLGPQKKLEGSPLPFAMGWVSGMVHLMQFWVLGGVQVGLTLDAAAAHAQAAGVRLQGGLAGELVPRQVPAEEREGCSAAGAALARRGCWWGSPK